MKQSNPNLRSKKIRHQVILALSVATVVIVVATAILLMPHRSVGSFCRTYKQENDKLSRATGNTYSTSVFSHGSNNPNDIAVAFANLDRVAPNEIEPEVSQLKTVFQTINANPAQSFDASISGLSAETTVSTWAQSHCGK